MIASGLGLMEQAAQASESSTTIIQNVKSIYYVAEKCVGNFRYNYSLKGSLTHYATQGKSLARALVDLIGDSSIFLCESNISDYLQLKNKIHTQGYHIFDCTNKVIICYKNKQESRVSMEEWISNCSTYDPERLHKEYQELAGVITGEGTGSWGQLRALYLLDAECGERFAPTILRMLNGQEYSTNVLINNFFWVIHGNENLSPVENDAFVKFQKLFLENWIELIQEIESNSIAKIDSQSKELISNYISKQLTRNELMNALISGAVKVYETDFNAQREVLANTGLKTTSSMAKSKTQFVSDIRKNISVELSGDTDFETVVHALPSSEGIIPDEDEDEDGYCNLADSAETSVLKIWELMYQKMSRKCFHKNVMLFYDDASNCRLLDFHSFNDAELLIRRHCVFKAMDFLKFPRDSSLSMLLTHLDHQTVNSFLLDGSMTASKVIEFFTKILKSRRPECVTWLGAIDCIVLTSTPHTFNPESKWIEGYAIFKNADDERQKLSRVTSVATCVVFSILEGRLTPIPNAEEDGLFRAFNVDHRPLPDATLLIHGSDDSEV